jgi:tRNA (cytidine/uridine-2'-O-)-methyltransferase
MMADTNVIPDDDYTALPSSSCDGLVHDQVMGDPNPRTIDGQLPCFLPAENPFDVVLVEPRIPQNVGNISRLCACTGSRLWLLGSLGFVSDDKYLKRAGMDYLERVTIQRVDDWQTIVDARPGWTPWFFSSKGRHNHFSLVYPPNSLLVFGSETHGLPEPFLNAMANHTVRIPMAPQGRSINLASSVAIILYDALKQNAPSPATLNS